MRRVLLLLLMLVGIAAAQPAAKFPSSVATWQDLFLAVDNSRSTLADVINASTLSIPVGDGSKFAAWQVLTIEGEKVLVCSVAGNTLTICPGGRGFSGTTAATHGQGIAVLGLTSKDYHNAL